MKSVTGPFQIVLKLLMRWWWLILICVALGAGVGYFIRSKQPDIYYAESSVWFGNNLNSVNSQQATLSFNDLKDLITVYGALARSPQILKPVIDQLNLGVTVDDLNNVIDVQQDENLPVLNILAGDTDAVKAATIANAIAQQIVDSTSPERTNQQNAFLQEQLRQVQTQIEQLTNDVNNYLAKGSTLTSAVDIAQNNQALATAQTTLQNERTLYASLSAGSGNLTNQARLFYPADAANAVPVSNSYLSVVLSGAAGLVLSLVTIIMIAFFDDRVQWHDGVETLMGLRILGPLGIIPRNKLPLYVVNMPMGMETEALRQLRAKIVLAGGDVPPHVITVTSYDSGDGKTVTASNLALIWAQAGIRTLLVDGDMRKGNLHEIFHLPNIMGLSDILAGHDELPVLLSRSLFESGYDHLTILPAGRSTGDPSSLLSKQRFMDLMEVLKTQFDAIIMDSVPTVGGPDSTFMADVSSGVVIVVHAQRTTHKVLRRTLQMLSQGKNVNIYGLAFNRIALQVTTTYNRPYYRRNLAINPDQLNRELAGKQRSLFGFRRNVIIDRKTGVRLYSLPAAAVQLGVTEAALKDWVKLGYLKTQRRGMRIWTTETDMATMLDRLPRHALVSVPEAVISPVLPPTLESPKSGNGKISTGKISDRLRGQREAILAASALESKPDDKIDGEG